MSITIIEIHTIQIKNFLFRPVSGVSASIFQPSRLSVLAVSVGQAGFLSPPSDLHCIT